MPKPVFHYSEDNKQLESIEINTSDYSLTLKPYQKDDMERKCFVNSKVEEILKCTKAFTREEAEAMANKFVDIFISRCINQKSKYIICFLVYATKLSNSPLQQDPASEETVFIGFKSISPHRDYLDQTFSNNEVHNAIDIALTQYFVDFHAPLIEGSRSLMTLLDRLASERHYLQDQFQEKESSSLSGAHDEAADSF